MAAIKITSKSVLRRITIASIMTLLALGAVSTAHAADVEGFFGGLAAVWGLWVVIVLVVLVIEWIFLPFAVFGIKPKLDKMIDASEKTNYLLEAILDEFASARSSDEFGRHRPFNSRSDS